MSPREDAGHAAWYLVHTALYSVHDAASLRSYVGLACGIVDLFPCHACRLNARANEALQRHLDALRAMEWTPATRDALKIWAYRAHLLVSARIAQDSPEKARWHLLNPARRGAEARRALLAALDAR